MRRLLTLIAVALAGAAAAQPVQAQGSGTVAGIVTAGWRDAIQGARVLLVGAGRSAMTDRHGRFRLTAVPAGTHTLRVQRIGYASEDQEVTVSAGGAVEVTFTLEAAPVLMNPVSVIASRGVEQEMTDLAVSASVLSADEVAQIRPTHVAETLKRLPGVHIVQFDGDGSHNAVRQPLCCRPTILLMEDGIPFAPPSFYTTSMIATVNYAQSGQVEALQGPGTAAYGSDAVTGVINFQTAAPPVSPGPS